MKHSQAELERLYPRVAANGVRRHHWSPPVREKDPFAASTKNGNTAKLRLYYEANRWCSASQIAAFLHIAVNYVTPILHDDFMHGRVKRKGDAKNYRYAKA